MRVFQIGCNKCATLSIHKLFEDYSQPSLSSVHWNKGYLARDILYNISVGKPPLRGYESYQVFTDMECFLDIDGHINWVSIAFDYFDLLDLHYPNSKFILNIRNIDQWITSRLKHVCDYAPIRFGYTRRMEETTSYALLHKLAYKVDNDDLLIQMWRDQWTRHLDNVITHFSTRPNDLLIYDIDQDPFNKFKDFFAKNGIFFSTNCLPHFNKTPTDPIGA